MRDGQLVVAYADRDLAVAHTLSLQEAGSERQEPSEIIKEHDQHQATDCPCFNPPQPRTAWN
jgi:hypothetical protein